MLVSPACSRSACSRRVRPWGRFPRSRLRASSRLPAAWLAMEICRGTGTRCWTRAHASNVWSTHIDIAALVHYQLGYLEWRLSSLVYMSTGLSRTGAALAPRRLRARAGGGATSGPRRRARAHCTLHGRPRVDRSQPGRAVEATDRERVEGCARPVAHQPARAAASRHDGLQHAALARWEPAAGSGVVARRDRPTGEGEDDGSAGA